MESFEYCKENIETKKTEKYGVFEKDGSFFMYLEKADDFIEIPKEVYRIIKVALYSEKREDRFRNKREKSFSEENKYKKTEKINSEINCHYTVFSSKKNKINNFEKSGLEWGSGSQNDLFDINERKNFNNVSEFKDYIREKLGKERFGISQIYSNEIFDYGDGDYNEYNSIYHSFYVGISEKENIIVFEKTGYRAGIFRITTVDEVFNKYFISYVSSDVNGYPKKIEKTYFGVMPYSGFEKKIDNGFLPIYD